MGIKNTNLLEVVICDLDGTLALFGDNSPYDRNFLQDVPNLPVIDMVRKYLPNVIFVSGRKEKFRMQTLEWLSEFVGTISPLLFMRKDGDIRKDVLVKEEIYENNIKGNYNILFILDDRDQIVQYWRSLGLTCLQVAEGDF